MAFTIRYDKTGKEIEISNSRGYALLDFRELIELGWISSDMWDGTTLEER